MTTQLTVDRTLLVKAAAAAAKMTPNTGRPITYKISPSGMSVRAAFRVGGRSHALVDTVFGDQPNGDGLTVTLDNSRIVHGLARRLPSPTVGVAVDQVDGGDRILLSDAAVGASYWLHGWNGRPARYGDVCPTTVDAPQADYSLTVSAAELRAALNMCAVAGHLLPSRHADLRVLVRPTADGGITLISGQKGIAHYQIDGAGTADSEAVVTAKAAKLLLGLLRGSSGEAAVGLTADGVAVRVDGRSVWLPAARPTGITSGFLEGIDGAVSWANAADQLGTLPRPKLHKALVSVCVGLTASRDEPVTVAVTDGQLTLDRQGTVAASVPFDGPAPQDQQLGDYSPMRLKKMVRALTGTTLRIAASPPEGYALVVLGQEDGNKWSAAFGRETGTRGQAAA